MRGASSLVGLPACVAGAYGYTLLEARGWRCCSARSSSLSVPLRRILQHAGWQLGTRGVTVAGAGFGFVNGAMTGAGLLLISTLMAAGVQGAALIATDAIVSVIMGLAKVALFGGVGAPGRAACGGGAAHRPLPPCRAPSSRAG